MIETHPPRATLLEATVRLTMVWLLLCLRTVLPRDVAVRDETLVAIFTAAIVASGSGLRDHPMAAGARALALCWLAGAVGYKACQSIAVAAGLWLGLTPAPALAIAPAASSLGLALATLLLGPVFEEMLYRGVLLPALERRLGGAAAIAISALLFAVPHGEPWQMLTCLFVGLMLGVIWRVTHSVWLCVAVHAGLNAGPQLVPIAASGAVLVASSAIGGAALLVLALRCAARQRDGESAHARVRPED